MDVNRVNSQRDATVSQSTTPRREARPAERAERSEPAERPEQQKVRATESKDAPKPVVNTQGQTTGSRINTSA